ncbi:hypothetical protein HPB47_004499 [Ixodes persulcatus]|uniref:Uncharacterized protein n=1 Tax=Ixodes persulcatus TaxID=34615 RepID=A0AC60PGR9_IXOPE|nr:hypothetical protein HPB47_004499 [Ixodes persulcatus]
MYRAPVSSLHSLLGYSPTEHESQQKADEELMFNISLELASDMHFKGWARGYTDESLDHDALTVIAAAVSTDFRARAAERLFFACSATAELAALRRAQYMTEEEGAPDHLVILSYLKAALPKLARLERAPPLTGEVAKAAIMLQRQKWRQAFQWLPDHCGIGGNQEADRLAASAQGDDACLTSSVATSSDARLPHVPGGGAPDLPGVGNTAAPEVHVGEAPCTDAALVVLVRPLRRSDGERGRACGSVQQLLQFLLDDFTDDITYAGGGGTKVGSGCR